MADPRITIVTPSFNQARYLGAAIESVLSQGYRALEYFVIDGGSTDGSVDVLRRFGDAIEWTSERDEGQADAINKGFARATGEIVTFLNSDDFYYPGALRRVADAFVASPEAGIVYGRGRFVTEAGDPLQDIGRAVTLDELVYGLYPAMPQPAIFFRRRVVETIGGLDASLHFALDGDFILRAFANFEAVFVPEVLAALRIQPQAKSVASGAGFAPEIVRLATKMVTNPAAYPRLEVDAARVMAAAHLNSARFLYNNGRYREAIAAWFRSLRHSREYLPGIALHQLPRLIARAVLGEDRYHRIARLSARRR